MSDSENGKDRRKYQRVNVNPELESLIIEISDYGQTLMFDMSYEGAAFSQPEDKKIPEGTHSLTLKLKTDVDEAMMQAQVIRVGEEVVAVRFSEILVEARVIIDRVVTDRIIGLNMLHVDPRHYANETDYSHWFHGPKDTNVYLWEDSKGRLTKAQLQTAQASVLYENNAFLFENTEAMVGWPRLNNNQIAHKAFAILEQVDTELKGIGEFREVLKSHVQ